MPNPPTPTPRGEELGYFQAAADKRLTFQICDTCHAAVFYLRTVCPHCGGDSLQLRDSAGAGTVYSYTVQHRAGHPYFADSTPMTLALVDLEEGFRVLANLVGTDTVEVGMPVEVGFHALGADFTLPQFFRREATT